MADSKKMIFIAVVFITLAVLAEARPQESEGNFFCMVRLGRLD
jgi:hypothetical protein